MQSLQIAEEKSEVQIEDTEVNKSFCRGTVNKLYLATVTFCILAIFEC